MCPTPPPSPPREQSLEQPPADCCILGRPGTAQRSFLPCSFPSSFLLRTHTVKTVSIHSNSNNHTLVYTQTSTLITESLTSYRHERYTTLILYLAHKTPRAHTNTHTRVHTYTQHNTHRYTHTPHTDTNAHVEYYGGDLVCVDSDGIFFGRLVINVYLIFNIIIVAIVFFFLLVVVNKIVTTSAGSRDPGAILLLAATLAWPKRTYTQQTLQEGRRNIVRLSISLLSVFFLSTLFPYFHHHR